MMDESSPNTARDSAAAPRSHVSRAAASSRSDHAQSDKPDVFFVGSGDCAALIDHIEVVESEPTPVQSDSSARKSIPDVVRQFRDRVANQQTGKPLAVRLDRRLYLPANAQRRKRVEDRIRAMHGTKLYDGRTLHVDEVLGRYGEAVGGTGRQLLEVQDRLKEGQPVRLAVSAKVLNDDLYRQLGVLSDRFSGRLNLSLERETDGSRTFYDRVAIESSLAHVETIRQRLTGGERMVLRFEPTALTPHLREEINALQREFGDHLRVEAKRFRGQAELTSISDSRDLSHSAQPEDVDPEPAEIPFTEVPDAPPPPEDRTTWAREVAARVRKPWWRRIGGSRKAKRSSRAAE